ncbi:hypothetical protein [Nostoc sp.]|uniref:hypothetical protein n=1 Tax=Nostoc sp. TaxID=1180 RepID=UPI002FFB7FCD
MQIGKHSGEWGVGSGEWGVGGDEGDEVAGERRINNQCPIPNAQCPMPNAQCPMPNALFCSGLES